MISKICIECDQAFSGRADKKFCDDHCRNAHNNRLNSKASNYIRNVNNALRKNRRILETTFNNNITRTPWLHLASEGFNFALCTHILKTKHGKIWHYCYEFGYMRAPSGYVVISRVAIRDFTKPHFVANNEEATKKPG